MKTKSLIALVVIFILWTVLDLVGHGVLLTPLYQSTPQLWRPLPEMKTGLLHLVRFVAVLGFVGVYACLVTERTLARAMRYGFIYGLAASTGMGFGCYACMPMSLELAWGWFALSMVAHLSGAFLLGLIVASKEN